MPVIQTSDRVSTIRCPLRVPGSGFGLRSSLLAALLMLVSPIARLCAAQELAPRSFWPAPKGTAVAVVGYSYQAGDVVTDPSLPLAGVDSSISSFQLGFLKTFKLLGRTANFIVELPYAWGNTVGTLGGEPAKTDFAGLGDLGVTLSVNLIGAPSMTPAEFQALREKPRPIVGTSLKVVAPTGEYDPEKLINIGGNRWAAKAEFGSIIPLRPTWLLELELGAWFFGDNGDFLGVTREQAPIVAAEIHLVKRLRPGRWVALELNCFEGGRTTIDGQVHDDRQRNSDIGATFLWTFRGRHAIKLGLSTGLVTKSGGAYGTALLGYQVRIN